ncbi:L-alanine exporter AlaE [Frigidibacter sp. MR17.24]|uniref:L-alanine exporter AlaE n=1 Tax=Frigidibacter sp. MR17.24 TaxID=3127345 RepID=UPI003012EB1A
MPRALPRPSRRFLVDTATTIVFFTLLATTVELLVAGMEPRAVLATRALMVPVMVLTGRPYGAWRDLVLARLVPPRRGPVMPLAAMLADTAAFLSFQVPVYAATLALAGASAPQVAAAIGSAIVLMALVGRPFGLVLDTARRLARVAP